MDNNNNNNGRFSLRQFIQAQGIFMQRFGFSLQGVVGAKFNGIALQRFEPIFRNNCLQIPENQALMLDSIEQGGATDG